MFVNVVSSNVRYFLTNKSDSGVSLTQFHLKGNNESKSIPKRCCASFQVFNPSLVSKTQSAIRGRSFDIYPLHSHAPLQLSKPFQVPFNPFSDSCLSETNVKIWAENLRSGNFMHYPRNLEIDSFTSLPKKKTIAQNYERETNLIQTAYVLN